MPSTIPTVRHWNPLIRISLRWRLVSGPNRSLPIEEWTSLYTPLRACEAHQISFQVLAWNSHLNLISYWRLNIRLFVLIDLIG
jgi:hypothetical protein